MIRTSTFIFAGHETTRWELTAFGLFIRNLLVSIYSGAVTRVLDTLSKLPEIQERLRAELTTFIAETDGGDIDRDKVDTLPYLDAICREVLRLTSPVSMTKRM